MTSTVQHRISRIGQLAARTALVLTIWFLPAVVAAQPAQAQAPAHTPFFTVLYTFTGGADGRYPYATMVRDAAGNLYGTTFNGGASDAGTVFKLDTSGTETVLYSFTGGADGANPLAGLVRDPAGNLYGTTAGGGTSSDGTVFKLDTSGTETVLHSFTGGDGAEPHAGLVRDAAGNLYGTTSTGGGGTGCELCGTVFKLDTSGVETVLHRFTFADGGHPFAGLVRDAAGNLYGTTPFGGPYGWGTVFKLDTSGNETVLHGFTYRSADGAEPHADLVRDAAGNLYGTTYWGGDPSCPNLGCGTVFKLDTTGKEAVLYSFTGPGADGANPTAALVQDHAGNLYGTTNGGGASGYGVVFKLDTSGTETVLHSFIGGDGANPYGGLVRDPAGNLYGTTPFGGASGNGVVFKLTP